MVVASPSDVQAERDVLSVVLEELNRGVAADRNLRLELCRWETDTYPGVHPEGPQGLIDPHLKIEDCEILIGLFWKRFGTPTQAASSGTEHEFRLAYEAWKRRKKPQILVYFNQQPATPRSKEETEQWGRVLEFQENFPREGLWWPYDGVSDFEKLIRNHLTNLIRNQTSTASEPLLDTIPPTSLVMIPKGVSGDMEYNYTSPVFDPRMFKGRREEKSEILDGLRQGDSFAIIGGTRIGKTSLLYELKRVMLEELGRDQGWVVGPLFLSTHQFPELSQRAIYRQIIQEFTQTIRPIRFPDLKVNTDKLFDRSVTEESAFPAFVKVLAKIVEEVAADMKMVIMIDEVDELQRHDWSNTFFNNLRHLISQTGLSRNVAICIAGTLEIFSLYKVAGSPFLNVISGTKSLRLLSPEETAELVGEPTNHQVDAEVIDHIYDQTGGHPFLIQFLMKHLCRKFGRDQTAVTPQDVDDLVDKFFKERGDFENWEGKFRDEDRLAYRFIAGRDQGAKKMQVIQTLGDAEQANTSLELLCHTGVIRETARNHYQRAGKMFDVWFQENVSVPHGD